MNNGSFDLFPMNSSSSDSFSSPGEVSTSALGRRPKALFILNPAGLNLIYGDQEQSELERLADFYAPVQSKESIRENLSILADVEVIFSGWGAPVMDEEFLSAAPNLKVVFYGAGTIRYFTPPAFWHRDIAITCAADANAIPVAEFTQAAIILSLKKFWNLSSLARLGRAWSGDTGERDVPGCFRTTVGLISLGRIARRVLEMLNTFDLRRLVYNVPSLSDAEAAKLRVEGCGLDEIFQRADVVSLHAPDLPSTHGMITGRHFEMMKPGATFINTARGTVVRETEMVQVLRRRPDITALLDVTHPEPPAPDSPLLELPNVVLTPHIAGSMGLECQRLGQYMFQEFQRYLAGEPLKWRITEEAAAKMA